jgi:hypothetical protein
MKRLAARLALIGAIGAALWTAACGGNGSFNTPPPNQGMFSTASLKGQYAFTTNGEVFTGNSIVTSQLTRVGSFTADGAGNITGGIEDANALGNGITTATISGGSYTVNSDGHGMLSLNVGGNTLQFSIVMTSVNDGLMVDLTFNNNQSSTGSGNFLKQNTAAFSQAGLAGTYAFDFTGQYPDGSANPPPTSIVGQLTSNGGGGLTVIEDVDEGGTPSGELTNISGAYSDATPTATLATFGRGVAQINDSSALGGGVNPTFVFYIVDNTRVRFLDTAGSGILSGDAVVQTNVPTNVTALNSGFVFSIGGADTNGPLSRLGRLTINGSSISNVTVDNNDGVSRPQTNTTTSASITLDSTGTGRGTLSLKDPNLGVPYQFIFYLNSTTSGVIQDVTGPGVVADGSLAAQSGGPFSGSNISGSYAFNWSGQSIQQGVQDEEDIIGQGAISSAMLKGVVDINQFSGGQQLGGTATATLTFAGDGTGGDGSGTSGNRNKLVFKLTTSSSATINFVPYIVSPNLIFFASTDSNRVVLGTLNMQH